MMPRDPMFDPVAIVDFAIDTGIFDLMYSQWGWPIVEVVHFAGLCLLVVVAALILPRETPAPLPALEPAT